MIEGMTIIRLSEDAAGESHFDSYSVERPSRDFAPPAPPFHASSVEPASGYTILRIPPGWGGARHPSPNRQILFCLAGAVKVTASDGEARTITAGDAWLMTDVRGKGHVTEVISPEPFDAVVVVLGDAQCEAGRAEDAKASNGA